MLRPRRCPPPSARLLRLTLRCSNAPDAGWRMPRRGAAGRRTRGPDPETSTYQTSSVCAPLVLQSAVCEFVRRPLDAESVIEGGCWCGAPGFAHRRVIQSVFTGEPPGPWSPPHQVDPIECSRPPTSGGDRAPCSPSRPSELHLLCRVPDDSRWSERNAIHQSFYVDNRDICSRNRDICSHIHQI
jgi:hypothetical protein